MKMKKVIIYVLLITAAAAAFAGYLENKAAPKPKEAKTETADSAQMPVIVWDKACKYNNTLKSADILAPVLFRMNSEGGFDELSSKEFTDSVNADVWGVFTNAFDPELTRTVMQNEEKRKQLCERTAELCNAYDLEGVNIDFENMYSDDSALFTEFIKDLSEKLHENSKILSVDVTKINKGSMFYSMCYDRGEISKYADYVILMGYDQYPRTSSVPGPVSALNWTEEAILDMLSEVPTEKFILGVPLYTRLWEQNGGVMVSSNALSMDESEQIKQENGGQSVLDTDSGLDYFEFENGGSKFSVWQENGSSLKKRIELAQKYNLSGIACWCLGFENTEADEILSEL